MICFFLENILYVRDEVKLSWGHALFQTLLLMLYLNIHTLNYENDTNILNRLEKLIN